MKNKDITVGMIYPNLEMKYAVRYEFWKGVSDAARKFGINLITFVGNEIQKSSSSNQRANFIYDFIHLDTFNGLLVWASGLANQIGMKEFDNYCTRFSPLPLVDLESKPKDMVEYLARLWMIERLYEIFGLSRLAEFAARYIHLEESAQKMKDVDKKTRLEYFRVRHELVDRTMRELFAGRALYAKR